MPVGAVSAALRRVREVLSAGDRGGRALAEVEAALALCDEAAEVAAARREARHTFLHDVGLELVASIPDYTAMLAKIASLAVPRFADWAVVDIVGESGTLERLAIAHVDPEKIAWVEALQQRYPPDPHASNGVFEIARSGRSEWMRDIPEALLVASARDAEHLALIRQLGLRSYIGVPLVARGRTLGVITFVTAGSGRTYDENDLQLAEDLATRAALALDNARLLRQADAARARAEAAEAEFRTLAGALPQIVWAVDANGAHEYLSRTWLEYTGQGEDEPLEARWARAIHPEDYERCFALWRDASERRAPWEMEYRIRRADGTYRWHLGRAVPQFDSDGHLIKWYGTATDIEDLKLAVSARDNLLAIVSHDLRTPLSSIVMAATLLRRADGVEQTRPLIDKILRASGAIERLIRDLIDLASIESGQLSISKAPVDPNALLREAREMMEPFAQPRGIRLGIALAQGGEPIDGDRERVLQVFSNLVGNAVKFTPAGGVIELSARSTPAEVEYCVKDSGPGIPASQLPHVFERFWRASSSGPAGLGLGLTIAKGIVEAHGGRIRAESEDGAGATFCFSLPRA